MVSAASVCLSVCLFVYLSVCPHDNFRTIKRRTVRCIVQKSRPSSNVKVKGQKSRPPGDKNEKARQVCSAVVLCGAVVCSDRRGRGYAGGKISACCLVIYGRPV